MLTGANRCSDLAVQGMMGKLMEEEDEQSLYVQYLSRKAAATCNHVFEKKQKKQGFTL